MILYHTVRAVLKVALGAFFRRVAVDGLDRVPATGPVLIVSNHTNAFVDPLLLLTRIRRPVTLTAKSTLAANPLLRPLMRAFRVVLLARRQDGEQDAQGNAAALGRVVNVLRAGGAVYIFPEGVSHSDPSLRPFRTGAARIALDCLGAGAAGGAASSSDLKIQPVGLHFERKQRWRSEAVAIVGEPWSVRAWAAAHAGAGAAELTERLRQDVEMLTLSFRSATERQLVMDVVSLIEGASSGAAALDRGIELEAGARLALVRRLQEGMARLNQRDPQRLARLSEAAVRLRGELAAAGITPRELWLPVHWGRAALFVVREFEILLVGAPLSAWGWVNFLPAYVVTRSLVVRMSRDEDHWASNAVFVSIPVFACWTIALVAGLFAFLPALWALSWAMTLPLSAAIALHYRDRAGGILRRVRTFLRLVRRPQLQATLQDRVRALVAELRSLETELNHYD